MTKLLPSEFKTKMSRLLGLEAENLFLSLEQESIKGLRVNKNKISAEDFKKLSPWPLDEIPWINHGFRVPANLPIGKHVFHRAGIYYIQEPSAMIVGEAVAAKKNEFVLDLAASPGGKSTHLASEMENTGLLVSNEINFKRQHALSENLERWGTKNSLQTQEKISYLAEIWGPIFDKVLLDAPCSGEGMFRKSLDALRMWSEANVQMCAFRQSTLISDAAKLVKPGGHLIYSTCTFSPEENEQVIATFLESNKNFEMANLVFPGIERGKTGWSNSAKNMEQTIRLWPHKLYGDGHFVAKLLRIDGSNKKTKSAILEKVGRAKLALWENFLAENRIHNPVPGSRLVLLGDKLFATPLKIPELRKLRYFKPGLLLGRIKKTRFEPAHSLAMALKDEFFDSNYLDFEPDDPELKKYLRGDLLEQNQIGPKGYVLITVNKYPLGWAKRSGYSLKNHLPRGLRQK